MYDDYTNQEQFQSKKGFVSNDQYHRKILGAGDNRFRPVGEVKVFYIHKFDAANGVRVSSVCVKDKDGNGECRICREYKAAWKILNEIEKAEENGEDHGYERDQVTDAKIKAGVLKNPLIGFKHSIGPKRYTIFNVIDRDSDLNKREKHTSLICKNDYELGLTGGGRGIFEKVSKLLHKNRDEIKAHFAKGHEWLPFDVNLIRSGKGLDTTYEEARSESYDLTPEEVEYERYNLNDVVKVTPDKTLEKWLTKGTSGKKKEESDGGPEAFYGEDDSVMPETSAQEAPKTEPKPEPKPEPRPAAKTGGFKKKEAPKPEPDVETDHCPSCDKLIPITSTKCPHCGEEFETYESNESNPY